MANILLRSLFSQDWSGTRDQPWSTSEKLMEQGRAPVRKEVFDSHTISYPPSDCWINPRILSDATIGLSDGLTVPFALTAGLSALGDTKLVIYAGLAELIAGSISMGLGGYLAAKGESGAYVAALKETRSLVRYHPMKAKDMVYFTFRDYDFDAAALESLAQVLLQSPGKMIDFLARFHHQLEEADYTPWRAYISGATIACGYFLGGLVPLTPYIFTNSVREAFQMSVFVMVLALFAFGWLKTWLIGERGHIIHCKNGIQMVILGGVAAVAAMASVRTVAG